ncbi:hypothetical protein GEU84_004635 [Fertoebacter nigrum]|uniref:TIGR02301 family protein n=1 Tax=Fertoeibacter niger TaxID=2656921 RepID=A0A8X8GV17_9RHOB|nr:hypothetical protein [Fertoeibacter niger]NUB43662.1 hypothetical protein [Fertoeibacter niger]
MRPGPAPAVLLALAVGLAGFAQPARADDGLKKLIPLVEIYDVRKPARPGFDVAGIRCAALFTAQKHWKDTHPRTAGRGPSPKQLKIVATHLTRSEIFRREQGKGMVESYETVLADVQRVIQLYLARFETRAEGGAHPWQGDGLIRGDSAYCKALGED